MTPPGDDSGNTSDHLESASTSSERNRPQPLPFDIELFRDSSKKATDEDGSENQGLRTRVSESGIPRSVGDIVFSLAIASLKKAATAAMLVFLVVLIVFGPNAPWGQLKWNILRGGPDEASLAQCEEIGDWFSLFDEQTEQLNRLMVEAGPPETWDWDTLVMMADQWPRYMDDWLIEMKRSDPPPAAERMYDLYVVFLENYAGYLRAVEEGDEEAQKYFERENTILIAGIDIETRHVTNLCI